jgi:predicted flap endonuclease-1-like 5' DNA nuclease
MDGRKKGTTCITVQIWKGENPMTKLETIEGIGPVYAGKLREAGIGSVEVLLKAGATPEGRRDLAEKTSIGDEYILDWVNRADLMRVRGVGEEYSDLLEWAGVDTVVELAQRNPDNLLKKMLEINEEKKLVRRPPTASMVARWVAHAKELPRGVSY